MKCSNCRPGRHALCMSPHCDCRDGSHPNRPDEIEAERLRFGTPPSVVAGHEATVVCLAAVRLRRDLAGYPTNDDLERACGRRVDDELRQLERVALVIPLREPT